MEFLLTAYCGLTIAIAFVIWEIGNSYDNPSRLEWIRKARIFKFKLLAIMFIFYSITAFFLVRFK